MVGVQATMSLDDLLAELKRDLLADEAKLRGVVALAVYLKRSQH